MSVLNKNYKQVVNVTGQVSELNISELECETLKTSSILTNSLRPRLPDGEIVSVNYTLNILENFSDQNNVPLDDNGDEIIIPSNVIILSATMKTDGVLITDVEQILYLAYNPTGTLNLIKTSETDLTTEVKVDNTGGILGNVVKYLTLNTNSKLYIAHSGGSGGDVVMSGTITYFKQDNHEIPLDSSYTPLNDPQPPEDPEDPVPPPPLTPK